MGAFFVFRQHDVVAACPKGGKDAANKGKQATKFGRINQSPSLVSDCESVSEEIGEQPEEQESTDFSRNFETKDTDEDEELDDEQDESEDQGMSMGM